LVPTTSLVIITCTDGTQHHHQNSMLAPQCQLAPQCLLALQRRLLPQCLVSGERVAPPTSDSAYCQFKSPPPALDHLAIIQPPCHTLQQKPQTLLGGPISNSYPSRLIDLMDPHNQSTQTPRQPPPQTFLGFLRHTLGGPTSNSGPARLIDSMTIPTTIDHQPHHHPNSPPQRILGHHPNSPPHPPRIL
jgi:hypothetical protein